MRIPEHKIEEVRSAANIVDIIAPYVQLRKRGRNFIGLCPFHSEKTPSFTVSEDKQIFHCFGCHAGGNVFKFLMEYEKISFIESVQQLAGQLGIELEVQESEEPETQSEQEILYDINTAAARYFSDNLLNHPDGEVARQYFEKRRIKVQTMRAFGLGYAFPGWEFFVNFARDKNIDLERAVQLGLIGSSNDGRLFDKFSGRIIFPIFSPNGRVIAFAGRILENKEGTAKYLNSPESQIYYKGKILYGLSHAKDEIRRTDKAILVEGYMDLISLYQNGIKNVVAVSGTALTEDQVLLLSRYTKNIVLLFDSDAAGIKASMRSIELLLRKDFDIRIASLPRGDDPDSYVNKHGKDKFDVMIKRAQNFLEFQSAYFESQGMFEDPAKLTEAIRELVKPLAIISDELKRTILLKTIAKKFNLREMLLEAELNKALRTISRHKISSTLTSELERKRKDLSAEEQIRKNVSLVIYNLERQIIKLLVEGNDETIALIINHIHPDDFELEIHKRIYSLIFDSIHQGENVQMSVLIEQLEDEAVQSYLLELSLEKYSISKNWEELLPGQSMVKIILKDTIDTVRKFKLLRIDSLIASNFQKMEESDSEEINIEMMKANRELEEKKRRIRDELSAGVGK